MNNQEIVAWHKNAAKQLRAEGKAASLIETWCRKNNYAAEHENMATFFERHPELDDTTLS